MAGIKNSTLETLASASKGSVSVASPLTPIACIREQGLSHTASKTGEGTSPIAVTMTCNPGLEKGEFGALELIMAGIDRYAIVAGKVAFGGTGCGRFTFTTG